MPAEIPQALRARLLAARPGESTVVVLLSSDPSVPIEDVVDRVIGRARASAGAEPSEVRVLPMLGAVVVTGNAALLEDVVGDESVVAAELVEPSTPMVRHDTPTPRPPNAARPVGIPNVPSTMARRAHGRIRVTMLNDGTSTWSRLGGYLLVPHGREGGDAARFLAGSTSPAGVPVSHDAAVLPGMETTFDAEIVAPDAPGVHRLRFRMAQVDRSTGLVRPFGLASPPASVEVIDSP